MVVLETDVSFTVDQIFEHLNLKEKKEMFDLLFQDLGISDMNEIMKETDYRIYEVDEFGTAKR